MAIRTRSRATSLLALLSVVLLFATSCSDGGGDDTASTETTAPAAEEGATTTTAPADAEPPSESPAASLRADLTGLLEEQVYLTGFTIRAAVAGDGLDGPTATAWANESGTSATDLSERLGAAYGVAAGNDFLVAWNDHREAVLDYAFEGGSVDDVSAAREGVLDVLTATDGEFDFNGVADGLEASDTELLTAVDELVDEVPAAAVDLRAAADAMPSVALDLATAITGVIVTDGEVDSPEAELRAELTGLLQESALLTGLALAETVQAGDSAAAGPAGVLEAVDENTAALAEVMEPDSSAAAEDFAAFWTSHIESFEAYITALIEDDAEGIQTSQADLVTFRDDVGELLAERYPAFTKEQVAEELVDHTDSILAYADALVLESGGLVPGQEPPSEGQAIESPGLLREAAAAMRLAARTLVGGLTAPAS
jgi:hypothetical protein